MFNPVPKPEKEEKKAPAGNWSGGRLIQSFKKKEKKPGKKKEPQRYRTTDGELVSQAQIDNRLSLAYNESKKPNESACECCGKERAMHHDHTLSQRKCKILKITEWIWNKLNWSLSCPGCHHEWESYKSGKFKLHLNYEKRMNLLKEIAPEEYNKRLLS